MSSTTCSHAQIIFNKALHVTTSFFIVFSTDLLMAELSRDPHKDPPEHNCPSMNPKPGFANNLVEVGKGNILSTGFTDNGRNFVHMKI
uniref:Secreted protein n=1 Tax=Ascaris lumbricoides TaxID=6252 RepID=A0A0M3IPA7_ASCLU